MQNVFSIAWIPSFNIHYFMGIDGISFPLVLLTAFVSMLAMGASWPITKHVKAYCILFLLLETGMLGVFLALDFFLFYVFWEVMLLPMYFLIGVWGGPRREYAAIKFFLYTLLGSVLMLIAILMLYFNSDLRSCSPTSSWSPPSVVSSQLDAAEHRPQAIKRSARARRRCTRSTSWPCSRSASTPTLFNGELLWGKIAAVVGLPAAVHRLRDQGALACRCTPGCPTRTSKPRRRSR